MRNHALKTVVALLLLSSPAHGETKTARPVAKLRIGVIAGLSGEYAAVFQNWVNGITLAHEAYQRKNRAPEVVMTLEDDGFSATKGLAAFRKLQDIDKIGALLNGTSATIGAISKIVTRSAFPVIQLGEETDAPADDNILQIMPGNIASEKALGEYLSGRFPSGLTLFVTTHPTMIRFATALREAYGSSVVQIEMDPQATDLKTFAQRALAKKPSCIAILAFPPQGALLVKALREVHYSGPLAFDGNFQSGLGEYEQILGDLSFLDDDTVMTITSEMDPSFRAAYRSRFNEEPGVMADLGYDAFNLLIEQYDADAAKWTANIKAAHAHGASGEIAFDGTGVRLPKFKVMSVKELREISHRSVS